MYKTVLTHPALRVKLFVYNQLRDVAAVGISACFGLWITLRVVRFPNDEKQLPALDSAQETA